MNVRIFILPAFWLISSASYTEIEERKKTFQPVSTPWNDGGIPFVYGRDGHKAICLADKISPDQLVSLSRFANVFCRQLGKDLDRIYVAENLNSSGIDPHSVSRCKGDETSTHICMHSVLKLKQPEDCPKVLAVQCGSCSKTVSLLPTPSFLTSPVFPVFLPLVSCTWTLIASNPNSKISIKFLDFDLPPPIYQSEGDTLECLDGSLEILIFNQQIGKFLVEGKHCKKQLDEIILPTHRAVLRYTSGLYKPTHENRRGAILKCTLIEDEDGSSVVTTVLVAVTTVLAAAAMGTGCVCVWRRKVCCWKPSRERIVVIGMEPGIPVPMVLPRPDISPSSASNLPSVIGRRRHPLSFEKMAQLNRMRKRQAEGLSLRQPKPSTVQEHIYEDVRLRYPEPSSLAPEAASRTPEGLGLAGSSSIFTPSSRLVFTSRESPISFNRDRNMLAVSGPCNRFFNRQVGLPTIVRHTTPRAEVKPRIAESSVRSASQASNPYILPLPDSVASSGEIYIDPRNVQSRGRSSQADDPTKRLFFKDESPVSSFGSDFSQLGPDDVFEASGSDRKAIVFRPIMAVQPKVEVDPSWKKFPVEPELCTGPQWKAATASAMEIGERSNLEERRSKSLPLLWNSIGF